MAVWCKHLLSRCQTHLTPCNSRPYHTWGSPHGTTVQDWNLSWILQSKTYWTGVLLWLHLFLFCLPAQIAFRFDPQQNTRNKLLAIQVAIGTLQTWAWVSGGVYQNWCPGEFICSELDHPCSGAHYVKLAEGSQLIAGYTPVSIAFTTFLGMLVFQEVNVNGITQHQNGKCKLVAITVVSWCIRIPHCSWKSLHTFIVLKYANIHLGDAWFCVLPVTEDVRHPWALCHLSLGSLGWCQWSFWMLLLHCILNVTSTFSKHFTVGSCSWLKFSLVLRLNVKLGGAWEAD